MANAFFKNKTQFEREHVAYSRFSKYPKVERYFNVAKLIRLRDSILVNMYFDRTTTQNHIPVLCDYDEIGYNMLLKDRWNIYENKPIRDISQLCYLLRQLVNTNETRLDVLNDIYKDHKKIIVFYNFNYELDILRLWCESINVKYAEWNGHNHQSLPSGKSWIYLCQYTAAQEAWNCTETDCMIFYSQTYSYKAMVQSAGRIDRMNTPFEDLYYYHLVSSSSIDIGIQKALDQKENFNETSWITI